MLSGLGWAVDSVWWIVCGYGDVDWVTGKHIRSQGPDEQTTDYRLDLWEGVRFEIGCTGVTPKSLG